MITAALFALALLAPADTPLEPVTAAELAVALATAPEMQTACDGAAQFSDAADQIALIAGDATLGDQLADMLVDWARDIAEDTIGDNAAFSPEAETMFEGWMYDCMGRIQP